MNNEKVTMIISFKLFGELAPKTKLFRSFRFQVSKLSHSGPVKFILSIKYASVIENCGRKPTSIVNTQFLVVGRGSLWKYKLALSVQRVQIKLNYSDLVVLVFGNQVVGMIEE